MIKSKLIKATADIKKQKLSYLHDENTEKPSSNQALTLTMQLYYYLQLQSIMQKRVYLVEGKLLIKKYCEIFAYP